MAEDGITRRTLATRGGAGALALTTSGTLLGALAGAAGAQEVSTGERTIGSAIDLQLKLSTVYDVMAASPITDSTNKAMARELGRQNVLHAARLEDFLTDTKPPPKPSPSQIPGLSTISSQNGYLELALGFENQTYIAYLDALSDFSEPPEVLLLAQLAAGTAQHLALLRRALGRIPVPSAFETGAAA